MNLHELGVKYNTDKSFEHNFCEKYEKLLPTKIDTLVEIGILDGGSLNMWAEYYKDAKILGYDILDKKDLTFLPNITTSILDQGNLEQLLQLSKELNDIDVIIDDGSHVIEHQIKTFETLFNSLKSDGIYILEDLHTSTNIYRGYGLSNNKGTLQYLSNIIENIVPTNYPGQFQTNKIFNQIKSVDIIANYNVHNQRSITALVTHK